MLVGAEVGVRGYSCNIKTFTQNKKHHAALLHKLITTTMTQGKEICSQLKAIRRRIADDNGIALDIPECTYHGECSGTCPRCEYELHYLESELARRQRLGKAAVVAGTVLTMASFQTANAQEPVLMGKPAVIEQDVVKKGILKGIVTPPKAVSITRSVVKKGILKGIVTEKRTGEPLISCNVVVKQNGEIIGGARTDLDGVYTIKGLAKGTYDVEVSYMGYNTVVLRNYNVKAEGFTICNCELVRYTNEKLMDIVAKIGMQSDSASENSRMPVIVIDGDDLPQDGGTGRYTIGGIETQLLNGTPASESGDPQPESPFIPDGSETNPLDKKK